MRKSSSLWMMAFVLTLAAAAYQRLTGPTYPVRGSLTVGGNTFRYRLIRTQDVTERPLVELRTGTSAISGVLEWKRHKTADPWTSLPMQFQDGTLSGELPVFPPTAKLEYRMLLTSAGTTAALPATGPVVIRFKGHVPMWVLIPHVIAMFGGMLVSTRAGLEYFARQPRLERLAWWTIGFLVVGGIFLGPAVQKYAFGAWWTGWPFGSDLTDNKTAVALAAWIIAALRLRKADSPQAWALAAAAVLLAVYMIPHSVLGSEMDYSAAPGR